MIFDASNLVFLIIWNIRSISKLGSHLQIIAYDSWA